MSRLFYLVGLLISCSQTAALTIEDTKTETIPMDNSVDKSVDSGELEDTAG